MPIDFVPTLSVSLSLAACGLLPAVLVLLSHGPLKVAAPGRRFVAAAGLTWFAWFIAVIASSPDWIDLLTGALLLATATLVGFTLWTLVAWGFTLSMLLALARASGALTAEEWTLAYTRGKALEAFTRDRLGVLLRLRLAEVRGDEVAITPRSGRALAKVVVSLRRLFGLRT